MRIRGRQYRGIPLLKDEEFLRDSPSFLCLCCCGEGLGLLYNNNPLLTAFSFAAFIALRLTNSSFFFSTILMPFFCMCIATTTKTSYMLMRKRKLKSPCESCHHPLFAPQILIWSLFPLVVKTQEMMTMSLHPRILAFAELQQQIHHICWWWRGSEKNPCESCHRPLSTPYELYWDACCSIPPSIKTQEMMMTSLDRILLALVIPLSVCELQHQKKTSYMLWRWWRGSKNLHVKPAIRVHSLLLTHCFKLLVAPFPRL